MRPPTLLFTLTASGDGAGGADRTARASRPVYDSILDARFEPRPHAYSSETCPPAPAEALSGRCASYRSWWRDPDQSGRPLARSSASSTQAAAATSRPRPGPRASRNAARRGSISPARTRRWCSGASCAASVSAAARDGKPDQATRSSERVELDPTLHDALLRHRPVPLLRRRRTGGRQSAALAAAAARRRSRRMDCTKMLRGAARASCCAAKPITSCS